MIQVNLVSKGKGDTKPTINTSELIKAGLLKSKPATDTVLSLKLVNSGGIVADQEFKASRNGDTLMAKDGWNDYLFDLPAVGKSTSVGVCSLKIIGLLGKPSATAARPTKSVSGLSALTKLVREFGTKVAAASYLGVSVDTFRRMLKKAEAEATTAPKKVVATKGTKVAPKTSNNRNSGLRFETSYGHFTVSDIKRALKEASGNKSIAAQLLGTSPRTFGRWLDKAGL